MFDNIKFEIKLKICKRDISSSTSKYFVTPQKLMNDLEIHDEAHSQSIQLQFSSVSITTIEIFSSRFTFFRTFVGNATFIKYAIKPYKIESGKVIMDLFK